MANYDALLQPLTIKSLTLRNRVMSSSHGPGYVTGGVPTDRFIRYHAEKAEGGIGLTILGSSSVALDSPSGPYGIISVREDAAVPHLRRVADAVHAHCGAVMIQLVQMGRRMHWDGENWLPLLAPSSVRERLHRAFPKVMEDHDYPRVVRNFADAARRCEEAGIDGIELSCAHLQLIDQHWSPLVNKRTDGYGGGFEGRMRFGVEVMEAMRAAVSADYVIGIRMSADELIAGGNGLEECLAIARYHAERGLVDFIDVIGGQSTTHHHRTYAIPSIDLPSAPFLALASAIRQAVDVPVFHAQKIADIETAARAVEEGHVDLAAMTRGHIADPHIVRKMQEGREGDIRPCVGANYCTNLVGAGRDALCMHNVATSREAAIPHAFAKATRALRVVVVGGGPGGLEAARVAAERGHDVTLYEAAGQLGGQLALATKAAWREPLSGIARYQELQLRKLGADIRLGVEATAETVEAEAPDVVIAATGARASKGDFIGDDLAVTAWDVLEGRVALAESALVYDDGLNYTGATAAAFMAERGTAVELATPDRLVSEDVGKTDRPDAPLPFPRRGDDARSAPRLPGARGQQAARRPRQRIYGRGGGAPRRPGGGRQRHDRVRRALLRPEAPRAQFGRARPARLRRRPAARNRVQPRRPLPPVPHRRRPRRAQRPRRRLRRPAHRQGPLRAPLRGSQGRSGP